MADEGTSQAGAAGAATGAAAQAGAAGATGAAAGADAGAVAGAAAQTGAAAGAAAAQPAKLDAEVQKQVDGYKYMVEFIRSDPTSLAAWKKHLGLPADGADGSGGDDPGDGPGAGGDDPDTVLGKRISKVEQDMQASGQRADTQTAETMLYLRLGKGDIDSGRALFQSQYRDRFNEVMNTLRRGSSDDITSLLTNLIKSERLAKAGGGEPESGAETPGGSSASVEVKPADTMDDAVAQAMAQHGIKDKQTLERLISASI